MYTHTHTHTHIYIYAPHLLYPFICQWTFRLLPCLGYCNWCYNEHEGSWEVSRRALCSCFPGGHPGAEGGFKPRHVEFLFPMQRAHCAPLLPKAPRRKASVIQETFCEEKQMNKVLIVWMRSLQGERAICSLKPLSWT